MKVVLLVEDDPHTGSALQRWISRLGYEVHLVKSVAEAKQAIGSSTDLAAVITDFHLGDGLGTEVEHVAKLNGVHCVIYSGDPDALMGHVVINKVDLQALTNWLLNNAE